jgi:hypothetical protein
MTIRQIEERGVYAASLPKLRWLGKFLFAKSCRELKRRKEPV